MPKRPDAVAWSPTRTQLKKWGGRGGRARAEALTPERRREIADLANAAQGRAPSKPWWELRRRKALRRHRCALGSVCKGWVKTGEDYFDRGGSPRQRACVPCVEALEAEANEALDGLAVSARERAAADAALQRQTFPDGTP